MERLNHSKLSLEEWNFILSDFFPVELTESIETGETPNFEPRMQQILHWEISYWEKDGEIAQCRQMYQFHPYARHDLYPRNSYSQCYRAWVPENRRVEGGIEPQPYRRNRQAEELSQEAASDTEDLPPIRVLPN